MFFDTLCQPIYKYSIFVIIVYVILSKMLKQTDSKKVVGIAIIVTVLFIVFDSMKKMARERIEQAKLEVKSTTKAYDVPKEIASLRTYETNPDSYFDTDVDNKYFSAFGDFIDDPNLGDFYTLPLKSESSKFGDLALK